MRKLMIVMVFLFCLSMATVSAANDIAFSNRIVINNQELPVGGFHSDKYVVQLQRGEDARIDVVLKGLDVYPYGENDIKNVQIKAEINGFDEDIDDKTSIFTLTRGSTISKSLLLELPSDMDASEDYQLLIEATTDDEKITQRYTVQIEEPEHNVHIYDVIFTPGQKVQPGQPLYTEVRLQNRGQDAEEDIRVSMTIQELGLRSSTYVAELVSQVEDKDRLEDEQDSASVFLGPLVIPEGAEGQYVVDIRIDYNNGREQDLKSYNIDVLRGLGDNSVGIGGLRVRELVTEQDLSLGGAGKTYTLTLVNMGATSKMVEFDVIGERSFGTARVDPQIVKVGPGEIEDIIVFAQADRTAISGKHSFVVRVESEGDIVDEIILRANVGTTGQDVGPTSPSDGGIDTRTVLIIVLVGLLVLLVILGIFVALRREPEETIEEPSTPSSNGKEYY